MITVNSLTSNYFDHQRKAFDKNFPLINDVKDKTSIHDLRVALKKIRTLFLFLGFISPGKFNSKSYFRDLRKLFRKIAIIRDLQVQLIQLKDLSEKTGQDCTEFLDFLAETENRERNNLGHWLLNFTLPDWEIYKLAVDSFTVEFGDEYLIEKSSDFIKNRLITIKKKISTTPDEEILHDIRRLLKEARFVIDLIHPGDPADPFWTELQQAIKATEDVLGLWHDKSIGYMYLKDFIHELEMDNAKKLVYYNEMLSHFIKEKEKLESASVEAIHNILTKYLDNL